MVRAYLLQNFSKNVLFGTSFTKIREDYFNYCYLKVGLNEDQKFLIECAKFLNKSSSAKNIFNQDVNLYNIMKEYKKIQNISLNDYFVYYNRKCYFMSPTEMKWNEAQSFCKDRIPVKDSKLYEIDTDDFDQIKSAILDMKYYFIGLKVIEQTNSTKSRKFYHFFLYILSILNNF